MELKYADTKLILTVMLAVTAITLVCWLWIGELALFVLLGLVLITLVTLQLHVYRRRQQEEAQQLRQIQALLSLFTLLPFRAPLPPFTSWAASPEFALQLHDLIQARRPKRILELGSGISTLVMAYSLEEVGQGKLISLDHDATFARGTVRQLERHGLTCCAEVVHAPLTEVRLDGGTWQWYDLEALREEGGFDMLVIDGPPRKTHKQARYPALPALESRLEQDAVVILDDAYRKEERAIVKSWMDRYSGFELDLSESPRGTAILTRR